MLGGLLLYVAYAAIGFIGAYAGFMAMERLTLWWVKYYKGGLKLVVVVSAWGVFSALLLTALALLYAGLRALFELVV